MTQFEVCWSDNDPEHWISVRAWETSDAAELGAEQICQRDSECYGTFMGGELITVRDPETKAHLVIYEVTVEMVPNFSARRKATP